MNIKREVKKISKRARTKKTQSKHDREVLRLARSYQKRGYKVKADNVKDFNDPRKGISGYIPDVVATKNGHTTIIEVETTDSFGTKRDKNQRKNFKKWAKRKNTRHYREEIV